VQVIDWKDSSLKWPIVCWWGRQTLLTHSLTHSPCDIRLVAWRAGQRSVRAEAERRLPGRYMRRFQLARRRRHSAAAVWSVTYLLPAHKSPRFYQWTYT